MRIKSAVGAIALAGALLLPAGAHAAPPPIKNVWIILLENKNADETFGNSSPAPYLGRTLPAQGELLASYYATTHLSLGDYIALVSGQSSNPITQSDCQVFQDVFPGTMGADGQAIGQGCVYPSAIKTIADQLTARGMTWKGYMEDMGNSPTQPRTCRHPPVNGQDSTQSARVGDQYAARHNPFMYFHSIIDNAALCNANVVPLDRLQGDLASVGTTPNYSFITPNLCNDGHDVPCVDGRPGGLNSADLFLRTWVPRIMSSPAYAAGGMLIIAFDEAESSGSDADASSCCNQPPGPNTPNPGGPVPGSGGGHTGAVVLSHWVRPGTVNRNAYNHYALLRSVQELFGLGPLGYSGQAGLRTFGADVYNGSGPPGSSPGCVAPPLPAARRGLLPRGSVMRTVRIVRRRGRAPLLEVRFRRNASFSARVVGRGRPRTIRSRRVRGCRRYRVGLGFRHGTVTARAAVGRVAERRSVRY